MLGISASVATAVTASLFVPAAVFCVESLTSLLPARRDEALAERPFRMAVLMPAHDEAAGIEATVSALRSELAPGDRLLVVADNCTDRTAELARNAGADVVERRDTERRGKGHALSFGASVLAEDPPDAVVIMDADCRVERGTLRRLAARSLEAGRPMQAVYLMHAPARGGMSGVSAFAFLVRNLVRPTGLDRLGMPCQLTGTGMAFPWAVFRDAPATEGHLVEDLMLGHELALEGCPPGLCRDVLVGSELPTGEAASLKQRRRWEHGQLSILLGTAPRLLARGLSRGNLGLVALALDAAVPPLALFVMLEGAATVGAFALVVAGGSAVPLTIAASSSALLGLGLSAAWLAHGRGVLPLAELAQIPRYVLWKLPLYGSFARKGAHREWERTERS
ncbi:MAG TPA: glycosyltransferase family 2 protein [Polyangiaceae bacterium]|nr:glycosyltransferase family 2 protein [Polyangiaceae bacterium]